jgi:acetyltransferase
MRELGEKGTRAAVVITAGVRDELKQAMLEAARPHLLRIQGPNCLGLMLPRIGLNASFSHQPPLAGDLAFLSQSGALITAIIDWARGRSVGFSHVVSSATWPMPISGTCWTTSRAMPRAALSFCIWNRSRTRRSSCRRRGARARSKPVIVVKTGRSATGARAALSHTGALAGADSAYEAAFRRAASCGCAS